MQNERNERGFESMENQELSGKIAEKETAKKSSVKDSFKTKAFRIGGYSVLATVIVIAIAIGINFLVSALPESYTKVDTTANALFSVSDQTKEIVSGLSDDVVIYWLYQSGTEDANIKQLLGRYKDLGAKLSIVEKDPVQYPTFASQYTSEKINNNSLIVISGNKTRYVDYYDIYKYNYNGYGTYDDAMSYTTEFDGEGAITSAIDYVTTDHATKLYVLSGHGEDAIDAIETTIQKQNIEIQNLNLITANAVPEDCSCIMINAPKSDISSIEKDMIVKYLEKGGKLLIITDYVDSELANIGALMENYGVRLADGLVVEGDADHYAWGMSYYLLPTINSHEITTPLINGGYHILMPVAQGILKTDSARDTVNVSPILSTTDSAYSKTGGYSVTTYDKEDGDIDGPFYLGVAITDIAQNADTKLVWLTSSNILDAQTNEMVSGANHDLIVNSIGWMCELENAISIHSKTIASTNLTVPSSAASMWTIVMVGILPLIFIAFGVYVTIKKRRA